MNQKCRDCMEKGNGSEEWRCLLVRFSLCFRFWSNPFLSNPFSLESHIAESGHPRKGSGYELEFTKNRAPRLVPAHPNRQSFDGKTVCESIRSS